MLLLTISAALLLIFASPGSPQNQTFALAQNQTLGSGSEAGNLGYGLNHSEMVSGSDYSYYDSGSGSDYGYYDSGSGTGFGYGFYDSGSGSGSDGY